MINRVDFALLYQNVAFTFIFLLTPPLTTRKLKYRHVLFYVFLYLDLISPIFIFLEFNFKISNYNLLKVGSIEILPSFLTSLATAWNLRWCVSLNLFVTFYLRDILSMLLSTLYLAVSSFRLCLILSFLLFNCFFKIIRLVCRKQIGW